MAARSKARKRAVDVLYEADVRGVDPTELLAERLAQADPPVPDYAVELVEGVTANLDRIDRVLGEHSEGWTVDRMPPVDRAVLRLALYELTMREDIPDAVAIDEAVELAKSLSTDESPRFVNGVLGRVLRERPPPVPPPDPLPAPPAPRPAE
jgi:N utilization substance protein B